MAFKDVMSCIFVTSACTAQRCKRRSSLHTKSAQHRWFVTQSLCRQLVGSTDLVALISIQLLAIVLVFIHLHQIHWCEDMVAWHSWNARMQTNINVTFQLKWGMYLIIVYVNMLICATPGGRVVLWRCKPKDVTSVADLDTDLNTGAYILCGANHKCVDKAANFEQKGSLKLSHFQRLQF